MVVCMFPFYLVTRVQKKLMWPKSKSTKKESVKLTQSAAAKQSELLFTVHLDDVLFKRPTLDVAQVRRLIPYEKLQKYFNNKSFRAYLSIYQPV